MHLVGISGSTRSVSYNTALLRAAFEELPEGVTAEVVTVEDLPIYDWEYEQQHGFPESVTALRKRVEQADGIVFATPEYNFSVTGALKNAIDWLSRGPFSPLDFKPAAIIGAGGGSGTRRSQEHLREILQHNSLLVLAEPQVLVPRARVHFDRLELVNDAVRAQLRQVVEGLVDLAEHATEPPPVRGSVLAVGPDASAAAALARQAAQRGYRTMAVTTVVDAVHAISSRAIAAVIVDSALDRTERLVIGEALSQHHPDSPVIVVDAPSAVGARLDDRLGHQLATR